MKLLEFLIFSVHFIDIFCGVRARCEVPEDLIPLLYSKYLDAINSDELQPSLRRVLYDNTEYNIHVRKLKEVNGLKNHNLEIKMMSRSGGAMERFYINNPVESKIPKAFLTLEEFKKVLSNRVNYKSTPHKPIVRKIKLDSTIIKSDITATMKTLKLVRTHYAKIVKGLTVNSSVPPKEVLRETVKTTLAVKRILRMNKVTTKRTEDKYSKSNNITENTVSISTSENTVTKDIVMRISSENGTTFIKFENITTVYESTPESNLSHKENPEEKTATPSEVVVTDNTAKETEVNTENSMPTEELEVETSTTSATKRSSLSRPLVFEMDDKRMER